MSDFLDNLFPEKATSKARKIPVSFNDGGRNEAAVMRKYVQDYRWDMEEVVACVQQPTGKVIRERYSALANMPIAIEKESIDDIQAASASIGKAANQLDYPTIMTPWMTFKADGRHDGEKIKAMHERARLAAIAIRETVQDDNVRVFPGVDWLPARGSIALVRYRAYLGGLAVADAVMGEQGTSATKHFRRLYNLPYFSVDADTTVGETALKTTAQVTQNLDTLFVNGTLEFTGGVMDMPSQEVAALDTGSKMLYLTEHMRRFMLNSLEPTKQRGYRPETGLGCSTGLIAALGNFNWHEDNNETFWLETCVARQKKDYEYLARLRPRSMQRYQAQYDSITIPAHILQDVKAIGRYEDFPVYTSIRGVEAQVKEKGVNALVKFDQGQHYPLWSERDVRPKGPALDTRTLTFNQITHLLDSIFSYFQDCGGRLTTEDLRAFNQLLLAVIKPVSTDWQLDHLAWTPQYIRDEEMRKI